MDSNHFLRDFSVNIGLFHLINFKEGMSDSCYVLWSTREGTHSSDDALVKERKRSTIVKHYHSLLKID